MLRPREPAWIQRRSLRLNHARAIRLAATEGAAPVEAVVPQQGFAYAIRGGRSAAPCRGPRLLTRGSTLRALRERFGPDVELVGVEKQLPVLDESLAADPNVRAGAADLREPLPFSNGTFKAVLCHNTLECLPTGRRSCARSRVLRPGGHLLLGHTDFDTVVFNASDLELTRRLVHANADTQEKWMDDSDGTLGRKLVGIGRHSPFELVDTLAWVVLDTWQAIQHRIKLVAWHSGQCCELGRPPS